MKRLIINADDFGLTDGVTAGIVESIQHGLVCSTTAMVCHPRCLENIERWASQIEGQIGVHLQLTDGTPFTDAGRISSLVTENGEFPRSWRNLGRLNPDDVRREWHAQLEQFLSLDIQPTHIDTHHHVHRFPGAFEVYCEIAQAHQIPARSMTTQMTSKLIAEGVDCPDYCETGWCGGELTPESLLRRVERAFARCGNQGTVELMCHPGYVDAELEAKSTYVAEREQELRALCTPELVKRLEELGIEIVGMSTLVS
jgi:chitin disaccharide deacetylase